MKLHSKIIVALDGMPHKDIFTLVPKLQGMVWGFKINDALMAYGAEIIERLKMFGNVMADPKLYDIPNTVSNGVKILVNAGADIITVHASAGVGVMKSAKEVSGNCQIFAITVLTSDNMPNRLIEVKKLIYLAEVANVDGFVCAATDLEGVKESPLKKLVPGIRPQGKLQGDDQVHISSVIPALADFAVVGRAITQAEDPVKALESLL